MFKKRLVFLKGQQEKLLREFCDKQNLTHSEASRYFGIVPRSFSDWLREKTKLPMWAYRKIPVHIRKKYSFLKEVNQFWYTTIGGKLGAKKVIEKYGRVFGDEEHRKRKWQEWWNEKGKYQTDRVVGKIKECRLPPPSKELAEFFGIMIGDGGITKYQCSITLNSVTDSKYVYFVEKLIYQLFKIRPARLHKKNTRALTLSVSRKKLNDFLWKLGLNKGNKLLQGLDIPKWIIENPTYQKACIRGLFDTDGCLFQETHFVKKKKYSYPRLNLVTGSRPLSTSVINILGTLDLMPKLRRNGRNFAIQIENKEKICQYFKIIGTSNPKHLRRWHSALT